MKKGLYETIVIIYVSLHTAKWNLGSFGKDGWISQLYSRKGQRNLIVKVVKTGGKFYK
jgi:hypothetical protein